MPELSGLLNLGDTEGLMASKKMMRTVRMFSSCRGERILCRRRTGEKKGDLVQIMRQRSSCPRSFGESFGEDSNQSYCKNPSMRFLDAYINSYLCDGVIYGEESAAVR